MYNEALYINADCQVQDALEFVLKTVEKINLELADDTERWLNQIFRGMTQCWSYHTNEHNYK